MRTPPHLQPLRTRKRADRGGLGSVASYPARILDRTLRLDGSNLEGGCGRRGRHLVQFALVARDLVGQWPLDEIPLAARIAVETVEAFEQR